MQGNQKDIFVIGLVVFFFAIGFFVVHSLIGQTVDQIVEIPVIAENDNAVTAFEAVKTTSDKMDYVVFGVFIALVLAMLITSWFISSHPILVVIYIIIVILSVVIGAVFANVWETASQSAVFGNTISSFPITNNILLNLPLYNVVVGILGMIMLFARSKTQEGGGGSY